MSPDELVVLRCATIVFGNGEVLVVRRSARGDWVLPGGRPHPRKGVLVCARREVREETGLDIDPGRCAFVLDTIDPSGEQRVIEVIFRSPDRPIAAPVVGEPGLEPEIVALSRLGELDLRAPLAGHIRALHATPNYSTAPYLAAAAVQALVAIAGRQTCTDLLTELLQHGPAPVRRTAAEVLSGHDGPGEVGG